MTPNTVQIRTPWLITEQVPNIRARLFCFPYAGGGASVYRLWQQYLPHDIQICALQPPGRESRISEAPYNDVQKLVSAIVPEITAFLDHPFAFFGHSTGALVAFELTRALRRARLPLPGTLMVSGSRPPHIPEPHPIHHLPEPEFLDGLRRFAGTPEELLQNKEIMALYAPILRADLALEETYVHEDETLLNIPVAAVGGDRDSETPPHILEEWKSHTSGDFTMKLFTGDHFYLRDGFPELIAYISGRIAQTETVC
ncbi:MAG: alpha/beta fold hydrolase [Desulfobacter sp.]